MHASLADFSDYG